MKCPDCGIPIKPHYAFCPNCGAGLDPGRRRRGGLLAFILLAGAVAAAAVLLHRNGGWRPGLFTDSRPSQEARQNHETSTSDPRPHALLPAFHIAFADIPVTTGQMLLSDIADNQLARITVAVSAGGWIAMPLAACLGARHWRLITPENRDMAVSGGILEDGDEVGLWQAETASPFAGPPIAPARLNEPLTWVSLSTRETAAFSGFSTASGQMNVTRVPLPAALREPGMFVQNGRMVGWTFGAAETGYLWKGPAEDNLVAELGVDDFYRRTFEGGREERILLAHGLDDPSPAARLAAFADGFRLSPMLSEEKTPPYLRRHALVAEMRDMIAAILAAGEGESLASVFDGPALAGTGDTAFMLDVLKTLEQMEGPEQPLAIIDDMLAAGDLDPDGRVRLQAFQNDLCRAIAKNDALGSGGLTIRFSPDAGQITTRAVLNRRLDQPFVVDTGATMVTIPSSAARTLGLDVHSSRRQTIMTAGGMIEAPEVRLEAVELEGWLEADVTAFVVDLPGRPGLGLLGLNYLNRFRLNVDHGAGELKLEPR